MLELVKGLSLKFSTIIFCLGIIYNLSAQTVQSQRNIVSFDFNPKVNGFQFKNYKNEGNWKDDLGEEDLIRMFGAEALCKKRDRNKKCVENADTRVWLGKFLKAMDIGHCEGIAVASLRMNMKDPFKKKSLPSHFQPGADSAYSIQRNQSLENYIAYYWITQARKEVSKLTRETARKGPVAIAKMLYDGIKNRTDTYLLGFFKNDNGKSKEGHAVAPFAVEETATQYIIYVYDNNFPGETRYLYIDKNDTQEWHYTADKNPKAAPDYVGDFESKTLELTATKWRENQCFDPPWTFDSDRRTGCGRDTAMLRNPIFMNASWQTPAFSDFQDRDGEDAEFFLTNEGDMLITDGNNRLGYDQDNQFYDDIPNGEFNLLIGGLGVDAPHFTLPYNANGEPYTIEFSGRNLTEESIFDFVFSAPGVRASGNQPGKPGFTVGFDDIRLDPGEVLIATLERDGSSITFETSQDDGETPDVFYAFDPQNNDKPSYIITIDGLELPVGQTLTYDIDFEAGKLFISDDDGNEDNYDIELIRINADGSESVYEQEDLDIGDADKYEMDFGDWKGGEDTMCFRDDDDSDGFGDEECEEQPNEDDGINEY